MIGRGSNSSLLSMNNMGGGKKVNDSTNYLLSKNSSLYSIKNSKKEIPQY